MSREKTVIALGFFDGIHLGHAQLLEMAKKRAQELDAKPAVLTFDNHPDIFVYHKNVSLITSPADRVYMAKRFFGIDKVFFLHFNAETMRMPWQEFAENIISTYNAVHFVVGHDFCFGNRGEGNGQLLRDYCEARGLGCDIIPAVTMDGSVISSTRIRAFIEEGNVKGAQRLLGHPYLMTDSVRTGFRIGRALNAPTINMHYESDVIVPKHGVYATRVILEDGVHDAVTNVGIRPTFGGENVTVETNILDFSADLYGSNVCLEFVDYIRPERKFDSPEELMEQITADIATARKMLGE